MEEEEEEEDEGREGGELPQLYTRAHAHAHTFAPTPAAVSWCNTPEQGAVINNSRGCLHRSGLRLLYSCDLFLQSFFFLLYILKTLF